MQCAHRVDALDREEVPKVPVSLYYFAGGT